MAMKQKPDKVKIASAILASALGFACYQFYDFYSVEVPKFEQESQTQKQDLKTKQGQLKRLQDFARNIQSVKAEFRELNYQLASALEHMPKTFNLSALLRRLTLLAQNSGVELKSFRPKKNLEGEKEATFYASSVIDIEVKGSFTQTLVFFDQVSRLKRIVNVDAVLMKPSNSNLRAGNVATETVAIIRTYRFAE